MNGRKLALTLRPVLAGVGLAIALYLTILHYNTHVPLFCSDTGAVDCAQVLTSSQSVVLGLPVAAWGLAWFAAALFLFVGGGAWRARAASLWTLVGAVVVIYLVYTELLVVGKICLWCTAVHIIVLTLFVLQQTALAEPR